MVKHVVMWRFDKTNQSQFKNSVLEVGQLLERLPDLIPELQSLEVGQNFNESPTAFDLVLITTHVNSEDLKKYQAHPEHQKVAERIGQLATARAVVDYEL